MKTLKYFPLLFFVVILDILGVYIVNAQPISNTQAEDIAKIYFLNRRSNIIDLQLNIPMIYLTLIIEKQIQHLWQEQPDIHVRQRLTYFQIIYISISVFLLRNF